MLNEKAGEIEKQSGTTEVVDTSHAAAAEDTVGEKESSTNFGRFKSAAELLNAYNSLESEFTRRCQKSKELERIFGIILDGRKSGSSISNVLSDLSDDLRELLALKRERKSAVMMSVMFLLISAVIATPFAIGMVGVYSQFMQSYGMESEIILTAPIAGEIYLIIHSILVAFIISIIMDGDFKKGVKFSLPLATVSFAIFYFISTFGGSLLMGGF